MLVKVSIFWTELKVSFPVVRHIVSGQEAAAHRATTGSEDTSSGDFAEGEDGWDPSDDAPLEYHDILRDSSTTSVPVSQVNAAIGAEREEWRMSLVGETDSYKASAVLMSQWRTLWCR